MSAIACCDKHGDEYVAEIRNMAEARTEMKEVNKLRRELYEQEKEERAERKDIAAQTLVLIQGIKDDGERVTALEKAIAERKITFGGPGGFNRKDSIRLLSQWIMGTMKASPKGDNDPSYLEALTKTLTTGGSTSGIQFVPVELAAQVYQLLEDEGAGFAQCTRIPMDTMTEDIADPGAVTLDWQSVLGGEGTAATDQTPTTGKTTLAADTVIATMPITNQLLRTSRIPLVEVYTIRFIRRISREFDKQIFVGTGAPFTGIATKTGGVLEQVTGSFANTTEITFGHLTDLIAKMSNEALRGSSWYFHPTMESVLRKIVSGISGDTSSIWAPPGGEMPATIYGIPYTKTWEMVAATGSDQVNAIMMIIGNLENALLGMVEDMRFDVSDQVAFRSYMTVLRAVLVGAYAIPDPKAFGRLKLFSS